MKRPDNRFRRDLRRRPLRKKNAVVGAIFDELDARIDRAVLIGDVPFPGTKDFAEIIVKHGVVPKLIPLILGELYVQSAMLTERVQ